MYFVYSLNLENYKLELYNSFLYINEADKYIDLAAREFIKQEEGEKRANLPYRDDILDNDILEDGYFLRHSENKNQIDVYYRKTLLLPGKLWNSYDILCKKCMLFSFVSTNISNNNISNNLLEIPKTNIVKTNTQIHMEKLKERLELQKFKIEQQINNSDFVPIDFSKKNNKPENDDEATNPVYMLKQKLLIK